MSWMDSWSRPKKNAATPPPLYLTSGGEHVPYCHTCGRVIGSRKVNTSKASQTVVKYCSDRCKRHKPSAAPDSLDRLIEDTFAALLDENPPPRRNQGQAQDDAPAADSSEKRLSAKAKKGDRRILVSHSVVEELVFGSRQDPEKVYGRRKNRARRGVPEPDEWKSVDMEEGSDKAESREHDMAGLIVYEDDSNDEDDSADGGVEVPDMVKLRIRPPQAESEVNGSIGGEKGWAERQDETPEMLQKRREGQRKAEEKEMVRCAARRAVAFGLLVTEAAAARKTGKARKGGGGDEGEEREVRKRCEAVMNGAVVEPSFAKGDWAIRWREEY